MSASLFVIEQSLVDLEELRATLVDEGDSEGVAVVDQQIAEWQDRSPAKVASSLAFVRQQENTVAACKAEEERVRAIRKRAESNIERYKAYVLAVMQRFDIKELKAEKIGGFRRQLAGGVQSLELAESLLPESVVTYSVGMSAECFASIPEQIRGRQDFLADRLPHQGRIREALKLGPVSGAKLRDRTEIVKVI
jgi:hypothetical protein